MSDNNFSFLAVADVHLGKNLYGIPALSQDLCDEFSAAVTAAIVEEVKAFIIVGDLFDNNRPDAEHATFVAEQFEELKSAGIEPVYIAGDHDTSASGANWTSTFGRKYNKFFDIAYIDYAGSAEAVLKALNSISHLEQRRFIFCHGMVPELWPFVDEKKRLPLRDWWLKAKAPNLEAFILGDIHAPIRGSFANPKTKKEVFVGYCGSLGLTSIDELDHARSYVLCNKDGLQSKEYKLKRKIGRFPVETILEHKEAFIAHTDKHEKPLFFVDYKSDQRALIAELGWLKDIAYIRPNLTIEKENQQVNVQREDIAEAMNVDQAIEACMADEALRPIAKSIVEDVENTPKVLDQLKLKRN